MSDELSRKLLLAKEIQREQTKLKLPHLYGMPWYPWAREFFDSTNKNNLLCAANQVSKSSTQIRKCIHWATEDKLWPHLWQTTPNLFWYMYPSQPVLEDEFQTKWMQFMPKDDMKDDPKYGWEEVRKKGDLVGIQFNSGILLSFKLYSQRAINLQAASVFAMFCDEEMPIEFHSELMNRMNATDGYFHMVFTATIGQDFWRRALEPGPKEQEELVGALKIQVSLYDSMLYEDGSPSQWTEDRISRVKARCKDHNEVQKRVYGKFIATSGRKYPAFDASRHMKERHPIPKEWFIYTAADPGSGGEKGHQAALCYVAVRPDFRSGRVIAAWRGDGVVTENSFVVRKHIEIKKERKMQPPSGQFYDWACKDFQIVAIGLGETFLPADKSHDTGEDIINTLFKNDMMFLYEDSETAKLAGELSTLKKDTLKKHAKDNLSDAFRYAVTRIPWDFSHLTGDAPPVEELEKPLNDTQRQIRDRRQMMEDKSEENPWPTPDEECEEWNELAGT